MARARNIKPALFKNELLGVADPHITLLFQSLWMLADKEGRLEDRPLRIKAETFPYREGLDINGYLTELQRMGFIVRYSVGSIALIQVVNFKKHQTPHNTEKASELPPIEAGTVAGCGFAAASVNSPLNLREKTAALPPDSLIPDSLNLIPDPREKLPHTPQAGQKPERAISLQTYLDNCKQTGKKPIDENHAVFDYADKTGIPQDFLRLQWLEFKARYTLPEAKRYKAWQTVFLKSVRGNWFKLWYATEGGYALTTTGQQAKAAHREAA